MTNYVTEKRALIEAIRNVETKFGIRSKNLSEDWVIRLSKKEEVHFIYAYGFDINTQAAAAIATDKVATYLLLNDANISSIPHYLLTTRVQPNFDINILQELFKQYLSLVLKPTQGSRGELVFKCSDYKEVTKITQEIIRPSWAVSPFIDINHELRLVVLDDNVKLAYKKNNPKIINGLKMFNLNLGASVETINPRDIPSETKRLAIQAIKTIGLRLGAVDVILDKTNKSYVLEINSGFSLEHYALSSKTNRNDVVRFYEAVISKLFKS